MQIWLREWFLRRCEQIWFTLTAAVDCFISQVSMRITALCWLSCYEGGSSHVNRGANCSLNIVTMYDDAWKSSFWKVQCRGETKDQIRPTVYGLWQLCSKQSNVKRSTPLTVGQLTTEVSSQAWLLFWMEVKTKVILWSVSHSRGISFVYTCRKKESDFWPKMSSFFFLYQTNFCSTKEKTTF